MLDHDSVVRLYGPWKRRTPGDAAALLSAYDGPWWIAGGWAIDAFVGSSREHGDLDIGIPAASLQRFVAFVARDLDAWAAHGSLTPLFSGDGCRLPDGCGNVWLRASGGDPWEYDVMLERVQGETWICKRHAGVTRPLADCLWEHQGRTYLRPEVQLLLKALDARAKDAFDLERCLPVLGEADREWLERSLRIVHPDHPWIEVVSGGVRRRAADR